MTTANDSRPERDDKTLTEAELAQQEKAIIEQASLTISKEDSNGISRKIMATEKMNDAFTEQGKESDLEVQVMPIINKGSKDDNSKKEAEAKSVRTDAQSAQAASDAKKEESDKHCSEKKTEQHQNDAAGQTVSSAGVESSQSVIVKSAPQFDSSAALAYELKAIRRRTGMLSGLIILICLSAVGGFFYLTQYQQVSNNAQLTEEQREAVKAESTRLAQAYSDITAIKEDIQNLKNFDNKSAEIQPVISTNSEKLAELSAEQKQNSQRIDKMAEQLKTYQSHNPDDWRIAQAYFLVNNAFQMGIFEEDTKAALWCLKNADSQIAGLEDPDLIKIREAISRDLMTLSGLPTIDTRGIIYRIDSVYDNLNSMPLKDTRDPVKRTENQQSATTKDGSLSNWKDNLLSSLQDFTSRFIEIRRRTDPNVNEFLSPEQINILRQNIQSELLMAKLAVYHRSDDAFKNNISQAQKLIENYFDNSSDVFKANITALKELKELRVAIETPDVLTSYTLFNEYAQKKLRFYMTSNNAADGSVSDVKREAE